MLSRFIGSALLFAISVPVMAQYAPPSAGEPTISPGRGQDQHQLQVDRYECYGWAKGQSGYDPALPARGANPDSYRRAFSACMSGRGYTVSYPSAAPVPAPPATPPPPPSPGYPVYVRQSWWQSPELMYRPVHIAIEGGPTVTAGSTSDYLNDGGNVGLGISFFPSQSLPIGLRVDGSWTRLDANHGFYDANGDYYHGHENIYGGDVDLQFNLAHPSARYQFYLLGGAGWYREQQVLDQFGSGCGYYGCGSYYGGQQSSTTGWRSSWNAGVGGEFAMPQGTSFFVEARYQRIAPHDSDMQFVPIRVGLRF